MALFEAPDCLALVSTAEEIFPGKPLTYIAALPFPGFAAGIRLAITEDDRGIINKSSLYSEEKSILDRQLLVRRVT